MDSRKSHCNPSRSPLLGRKSFALALTLLNYHSIAIATLGELFNRSEKAAAIVLWCSTDRGCPPLVRRPCDEFVSLFLSAQGHSDLPSLRIHALAQVHQSLVESVDSNQTQPRVFDIQDDIH